MHAALQAICARMSDSFNAWPYVDDLYDYTKILGVNQTIASLPNNLWGTPVAIIGAGAAGMVAAYELLKIGAKPVVFEATDRVGGRDRSQPFTEGNHVATSAFAELGAMYLPAGHRVLSYYVNDVFHLETFSLANDINPTMYYCHNTARHPDLSDMSAAVLNFFDTIIAAIYEPWKRNDLDGVRQIWQSYIEKYKNLTVNEAMTQGISSWTTTDSYLFRTLGLGGGGLGQPYELSFLDVLRMLLSMGHGTSLLAEGMSALTSHFFTGEVVTPDNGTSSLRASGAVHFGAQATSIVRASNGNPVLTYYDALSAQTVSQEFPAVIVAISLRASELLGLALTAEPAAVIASPVQSAIRSLRLIPASKMFIRTETKFWKEHPEIPKGIVTDEMPRFAAVFDYPQTTNGVVMLSETWGPDAERYMGLPVPVRFQRFKEILAVMSPVFAQNLVPLNDEIITVDWTMEPYHYGGFRLNYPGDDVFNQNAYYQFLSVLDPATDRGVYLAGEGVAWCGGWTESALHTGINAAAAAAHRIGATLPVNSPLSQNPHLYAY